MVAPGKKKSTFVVDEEIYKRIRILSIERDVDISIIIEEAMREKVQREYPDYKPPVSVLRQQQQYQPRSEAREFRESIVGAFNEAKNTQSPDEEIAAGRERERKERKKEAFDESITK